MREGTPCDHYALFEAALAMVSAGGAAIQQVSKAICLKRSGETERGGKCVAKKW
jgi:hypothetical protein